MPAPALACIALAGAALAHAGPITYQGVLSDASTQASGDYDLRFDLYTDLTPGGPDVIVATELVTGVRVVDGRFTAEIPFNPLAFNGDDRFLQIACRPSGGGSFTTLLPRQPVTDAPHAVHAAVARSLALPATLSGATFNSGEGLLEIEHTNLNSGSALKLDSPWSGLVVRAGDTNNAPIAAIAPAAVVAFAEQTAITGASDANTGVRGATNSGFGGDFSAATSGTALRAYNSGTGAAGELFNTNPNSSSPALYVHSSSTRAFTHAVRAVVEPSSPGSSSTALRGENNGTGLLGIGVWGSHKGSGWGVFGTADGAGRGVFGSASGSGGAGVFGRGYSGANAGQFIGDVHVSGALSKSSGTFLIDHPLDPANKYLSHSFVESPDMKNIYDGVATLDGSGRAEVVLPDYFEALNTDFRYQLTCLGGHAPVFIEREISNNTFVIAGGSPNMRVSWQVTGSRQDAYAARNPVVVEAEKAPEDRGKYLNPEAFGKPMSDAIGYQPTPN